MIDHPNSGTLSDSWKMMISVCCKSDDVSVRDDDGDDVGQSVPLVCLESLIKGHLHHSPPYPGSHLPSLPPSWLGGSGYIAPLDILAPGFEGCPRGSLSFYPSAKLTFVVSPLGIHSLAVLS